MLVGVRFGRKILGLGPSLEALTAVILCAASLTLANPNIQLKPISPNVFIQNCGQWPDSILFQTKVNDAVVWFSQAGLYYQLFKRNDSRASSSDRALTRLIHEEFVGGNRFAEVIGENVMEYRCNYLLGNDSTKWTTGVLSFGTIRYHDIYPGIDLRYYYRNGHLEYDFLLSPDANPLAILIEYEGGDSLMRSSSGELIVMTDWGKITQLAPTVYEASSNRLLQCDYNIKGTSFGFFLSQQKGELAIVIDPVITFSTFLGGGGIDIASDVATDENGIIAVSGYTLSNDFPVACMTSYRADWDAYLTRLSPSGDEILCTTYFGGEADDRILGISTHHNGDVTLVGHTSSYDFPLYRPVQDWRAGDNDGFVLKLSSSGNLIRFSTYLGGSTLDEITDVAVDESDFIYLCGMTWSNDFPTKNAYSLQAVEGISYFVSKLESEGDSIVYSTYVCSANSIGRLAVDAEGCAILAGQSPGEWFPLKRAIDSTRGLGAGGIVVKLGAGGDNLIFSTYLSGSDGGILTCVDVDREGRIYIGGATVSRDYPLVNALDSSYAEIEEGILSVLDSSGQYLLFSSFWGGSGWADADHVDDIVVDSDGTVYAVGTSCGIDLLRDPIDNTVVGETETYFTKFTRGFDDVVFSTYIGGNEEDLAAAIALSENRKIFVVGTTTSIDFPLTNAVDPTMEDGFSPAESFVTCISEIVTSIPVVEPNIADTQAELFQNYPNPFNNQTVIRFQLGNPATVKLIVYNVLGEAVRTLIANDFPAGLHTVSWDGDDTSGEAIASGVYYLQLTTDRTTVTRKMLYIK